MDTFLITSGISLVAGALLFGFGFWFGHHVASVTVASILGSVTNTINGITSSVTPAAPTAPHATTP